MSTGRRVAFGALAVALFLLFAGSSSSGVLVHAQSQAPANTRLQPFTILSPNFHDGGPLPLSSEGNAGGCTGKDIASSFFWTNVPAQTSSFALLMNDVDAPISGGFHHWITYNIPATARTLHGNAPFTQGTNSANVQTYVGPCPPPTGERHHYIFTLYALSIATIPQAGLTFDGVLQAISGKVVGATTIVGTFFRVPANTDMNAG